MDVEALRKLALDVSSTDFAVSRDASRQLQAFLTASQVVGLLTDPSTSAALDALLQEVEAVENVDVYRLLGSALRTVFTSSSEAQRDVLFAPSAQFLIAFVVRAAAAVDTTLAASMLGCLESIVLDAPAASPAAASVGHLLDDHFHNDRVLRLFNCDQVEATENARVCAFLDHNTSLLPFLLAATEGAFVNDPLLLANYLVASGVVCRSIAVPHALRQATMQVLRAHDDPLYYAFVCRFWGIVLLRQEENGASDAAACVSAVMPVVEGGERDEDATEAAFEVLGAAATTQAGWDAVTSLLSCATLQGRLCSTSSSLRLSTLNLLLSMLTSAHVVPSYFTKDLMLDAWQTRTTPDDEVRLSLWRLVLAALRHEDLAKVLAAVCASFLCSGAYEENITVRSLKLQAATYLVKHSTLPESVVARLKQFIERGLYPVGSGGVSLMTKD